MSTPRPIVENNTNSGDDVIFKEVDDLNSHYDIAKLLLSIYVFYNTAFRNL